MNTTRFMVASQVGALRELTSFTDPLGTGAQFLIRGYDSKAFRSWQKKRAEEDPIQAAVLELTLTSEEMAQAHEAKDSSKVMRLATRHVLATGQLTAKDVFQRLAEARLEEALALLAGWENLPDPDGVAISYHAAVARELLSLEDVRFSTDLPADVWNFMLDEHRRLHGDRKDYVAPEAFLLGEIYVTYVHHWARKTEAFRGKVLELAAKNSETSSDGNG